MNHARKLVKMIGKILQAIDWILEVATLVTLVRQMWLPWLRCSI